MRPSGIERPYGPDERKSVLLTDLDKDFCVMRDAVSRATDCFEERLENICVALARNVSGFDRAHDCFVD